MKIERIAIAPLRAIAGIACTLLATAIVAVPAIADPCTGPGCALGEINAWADELVELNRGFVFIDVPEAGLVTHGIDLDVLGERSGLPTEAVSLGDGGSVIVGFEEAIYDGPDFDFAVFENGITSGTGDFIFLELGFVEVSSDGVSFARFPSLTSRTALVATNEEVDPDDYANLASNVLTGFGAGFDLVDLSNHPLVLSGDVDLDDIHYVRIEDVIGDGSTSDGMGNPIFDPFPTAFTTGGFDLDAVGAINVPEPGASAMLFFAGSGLFLLQRRRGAGSDTPS